MGVFRAMPLFPQGAASVAHDGAGAHRARALFVLAPILLFGGCTPSLTYHRFDVAKVVPGVSDPANPGQREVAFALQTSSLVVSAPEDAQQKEKKPFNCSGSNCFEDAVFTLVPERDNDHLYIARLARGTKLSVVPFETDPLLPKTITQSFSDPAAAAIAKAASFAALGAKAVGPWGLVFAVGAVTPFDTSRVEESEALIQSNKGVTLALLSCDGSTGGMPEVPNVRFPFAIHKMLPDPAAAAVPVRFGSNACWHRVTTEAINDGWFYRVTPDPPLGAPGVPAKARAFPPSVGDPVTEKAFVESSTLGNGKALDYWPATACRRVVFELVWWTSLVDNDSRAVEHRTLQVSDPSMAQKLSITKDGRTIVLRAACGGYATSGPAAEQAGVLSAVLKGYNDFRDAEAAHEK